MDPDETLRQIRLLIAQLNAEDGNPPYPLFVQHARDLAEAVENLDAWITAGGSAPSDWPLVGMAR